MGINSRESDGLTDNPAAEQQAVRLSGEPVLAKGISLFIARSAGETVGAACTSGSRFFQILAYVHEPDSFIPHLKITASRVSLNPQLYESGA